LALGNIWQPVISAGAKYDKNYLVIALFNPITIKSVQLLIIYLQRMR